MIQTGVVGSGKSQHWFNIMDNKKTTNTNKSTSTSTSSTSTTPIPMEGTNPLNCKVCGLNCASQESYPCIQCFMRVYCTQNHREQDSARHATECLVFQQLSSSSSTSMIESIPNISEKDENYNNEDLSKSKQSENQNEIEINHSDKNHSSKNNNNNNKQNDSNSENDYSLNEKMTNMNLSVSSPKKQDSIDNNNNNNNNNGIEISDEQELLNLLWRKYDRKKSGKLEGEYLTLFLNDVVNMLVDLFLDESQLQAIFESEMGKCVCLCLFVWLEKNVNNSNKK